MLGNGSLLNNIHEAIKFPLRFLTNNLEILQFICSFKEI